MQPGWRSAPTSLQVGPLGPLTRPRPAVHARQRPLLLQDVQPVGHVTQRPLLR